MSDMKDPIIETLKHLGLPLTRANYLNLENLGGKGTKLDPEVDSELPQQPRFQAHREVTHEELAADENDTDASSN